MSYTDNTETATNIHALPQPQPDYRGTVDQCYREGDLPVTMAHLVHQLGIYDVQDEISGVYYWIGTQNPAVWLRKDGEVNVDLEEVHKINAEVYNDVIGWCVSQRIPCVLHGETARHAWRP